MVRVQGFLSASALILIASTGWCAEQDSTALREPEFWFGRARVLTAAGFKLEAPRIVLTLTRLGLDPGPAGPTSALESARTVMDLKDVRKIEIQSGTRAGRGAFAGALFGGALILLLLQGAGEGADIRVVAGFPAVGGLGGLVIGAFVPRWEVVFPLPSAPAPAAQD